MLFCKNNSNLLNPNKLGRKKKKISFKFVDQSQVFKEIKKLDGNKANQKMISQSKQ